VTRNTLIAVLAATLALGWLACSGRLGGVPRNVTLAAASDSTIALAWDEPEAGTPDNYVIYFRQVGTEAYVPVAEPTGTSISHDPAGMTGRYRVAARFGADLHHAAETLSTVPVETPELALAELSASGNSGLGWNRVTGEGTSFPMRQPASAASVDLFVTDFELGSSGPTYSLASPTYGPSDPSGEVPQAPWRLTRFTADLPDERAPLPSYSEQGYLPFRAAAPGFAAGGYTEDGYYVMVKVVSVNTLTGELRLRGWFQLVPGLRLIRH
jgi:hypothetical protein